MYTEFKIPKNHGGYRTIEAPDSELKQKQQEILIKLYDTIPISPFAFGGAYGRNIVMNAMCHTKQEWIGSVDISNCFPSVKKDVISEKCKKVFESHKQENLFTEVSHNCFYKDHLPQGAPTSPYLLNIFLRDLDWHLANLCFQRGMIYSRYFDDITISTKNKESNKHLYSILTKVIPYFLEQYKLVLNKDKTKIVGRHRRQLVCGIVVNEKVNLPRNWRKNLRAAIFQGRKDNHVRGKIAYQHMVREKKYGTLNSISYLIVRAYQQYMVEIISGESTVQSGGSIIRSLSRKPTLYKDYIIDLINMGLIDVKLWNQFSEKYIQGFTQIM